MAQHTVRSFDDELAAIRGKISEMGGISEGLLLGAIQSIRTRDPETAKKVIRLDRRLDELEAEIEETAIQLIARRQPVARDLRTLVAVLKLSAVLERIGDLAKNIARRNSHLASFTPAGVNTSVVRMGQQALSQLTEVLDAWAHQDIDAAIGVWRRDVELDDAYNSLFREVIALMMEEPQNISVGSQVLFIAKNLERIGDHATQLSEMIYYIEEGHPLGDDRPKGEPSGLETAG